MPKSTFFNLHIDKREKIEKALEEEFGRTSFSEASISNIIKEAQIPRGSFYQYFEDKEDAVKYILQKYMQMEKENMNNFLVESKGNIFETFLKLYDYMIERAEIPTKMKLYKNILDEMKKNDINIFEEIHNEKQKTNFKNLVDTSILNIEYDEDLKYILKILSIVIRISAMDVITKKVTKEQGRKGLEKQIKILKKGMEK